MSMKFSFQWRRIALALTAMVLLGACSPVVIIPDQALESAIRAELGKPLSLFLTKRDMEKIRFLDASDLTIANLEGIQYCVNLDELNLNNNSIRSINQLAPLVRLVKLHLGNNRIMDIEAVAGLLSLEYLDVSGESNVITDWKHLQANVLNGGLGAESVAVFSSRHTLDSSGNALPGFAGAYDAMLRAGVIVEFKD